VAVSQERDWCYVALESVVSESSSQQYNGSLHNSMLKLYLVQQS